MTVSVALQNLLIQDKDTKLSGLWPPIRTPRRRLDMNMWSHGTPRLIWTSSGLWPQDNEINNEYTEDIDDNEKGFYDQLVKDYGEYIQSIFMNDTCICMKSKLLFTLAFKAIDFSEKISYFVHCARMLRMSISLYIILFRHCLFVHMLIKTILRKIIMMVL